LLKQPEPNFFLMSSGGESGDIQGDHYSMMQLACAFDMD
jgi:hypothetical protein